MATFPSIAPIHSLNENTSPIVLKTRLGDGNTAFHRTGLNSTRPEWQLAWLVDWTDAQTIDTFLRARATAAEAFDWTPPDANLTLKWRCSEWSLSQEATALFRIEAVFKQVFELASPLLIATPAICLGDALCEGDYGDIGTDFWISKAIAPFSNTGYQGSPSYVGAVIGAHVVTDAAGYSYCVMVVEDYGVALYLAITKRKLNGEVIWTKEHNFIGYDGVQYTMGLQGALIGDIGDGKESIIVFFPEWQGYQHDSFAVYSTTDGSFKYGLHVGGNTIPQGHTLGIGVAAYSKYVVMLRNELNGLTFDVVDAKNAQLKAGWGIVPAGTVWPSNVDTPESADFIEFDSGQSIVFFNQYSYRLLVIPLDEDFAPVSSDNKRYYNCGSGCASTEFGLGCLVATSARIYYFSRSGELLREVIHGEGYPLQISADSSGIYLLTNGPSRRTTRTVKISLDFSSISTRNHLSGANNNFIGDWTYSYGGSWGLYENMNFHTPTNRVVASYSTFSNNAYEPSPSNYPAFQVFGGRISKVGAYTTMSVGEYTASAAGYSIGTPLTSYTTPTSVETNTCSLGNRAGNWVQVWSRTMVDASDKYQWQLYTSDFGLS